MADRVANLLAFGSLAPEEPANAGLARMSLPSWYQSGTGFGILAPQDVPQSQDNGELEKSAYLAELGRRINPKNWDAMLNANSSDRVEDRRDDPRTLPWFEMWADMKRNNIIARWLRNGQYAGPGYDYQPWPKANDRDPMAIALGADQIPVTSYGTTHPLKRHNPDYNSDSPLLPWNRK